MARNVIRDLLQSGDVHGLMRVWAQAMPQADQPKDVAEATIMMHLARTQAESLTNGVRLYSHAWLLDRGLPSRLPDRLKAKHVEQRVVTAVGVSVLASTPELEPVAQLVERAMADAVEECYAHGEVEPALVQARMAEARGKTIKQLLGR